MVYPCRRARDSGRLVKLYDIIKINRCVDATVLLWVLVEPASRRAIDYR